MGIRLTRPSLFIVSHSLDTYTFTTDDRECAKQVRDVFSLVFLTIDPSIKRSGLNVARNRTDDAPFPMVFDNVFACTSRVQIIVRHALRTHSRWSRRYVGPFVSPAKFVSVRRTILRDALASYRPDYLTPVNRFDRSWRRGSFLFVW